MNILKPKIQPNLLKTFSELIIEIRNNAESNVGSNLVCCHWEACFSSKKHKRNLNILYFQFLGTLSKVLKVSLVSIQIFILGQNYA